MRRSLLVFVGLVAGCDGIRFWNAGGAEDEGIVCVVGEGGGVAAVYVFSDDCLSSECTRAQTGACVATLDGDRILVESTFSWESKSGIPMACTDDCGDLTASCSVGPLEEGSYTLLHGGDELVISIPNQVCTRP
jgi:hypothetical protein